MDDFFARFNTLHQEYLNKFKRKLNNARQPETDKYWMGWNAGLAWAERIIDGDKSAD